MEWKVQNALNRDVERQHLNKILKEIEARISDVRGQASPSEITRIVERVIRAESPDALASVTVNLTGDVSGQGTTNEFGRVNIDVEIDPSKLGITEAPIDSRYYWRINGTWEQVSDAVSGLQDIVEPGVLVYTGGTPPYRSLIVEGVEDEVVVANGDGQDLDLPSISVGLADLENTEEGVGPLKIYTRDSKGRIEGDEPATTDLLPEGLVNLYHTDERAQDAVGSILDDTADIVFTYDAGVPSISAELSSAVQADINSKLDYEALKDTLVAGSNTILTPDDMAETITISATGGGGGGGGVDSVIAGTGISVNNTNPSDPVVSLSSTAQASLALANTSVQPADLADVATSGDYTDLVNTPTIPTDLSDLSGTSDDITEGSTNLYLTSSERSKLAGVEAGAQVNTVTSVNAATGAVVLDYDDVGAASTTDPRLSNSREWTATTVSQAEAEAGTATTRRAWTAQRVRQAIVAWWNGSSYKSKLDGIQAGAQVNSVTSVNSQTGAVSLNAGDVGAEPSFAKGSLIAGSNVSFTGSGANRLVGSGNLTVNVTGGGSGTVTSVGLSAPTGFSVSNSPITSSGTLGLTYSAGYQGYTSAEASKLSGIAAGATVGANWNTNLANIPANITAWAGINPTTKLDTAVATGAGIGVNQALRTEDFSTLNNATAAFISMSSGAIGGPGLSGASGIHIPYSASAASYNQLAIGGGSVTPALAFSTIPGTWHSVHHTGNFNPADKADTSTTISAGAGLTGGGSLAGNFTLSMGAPSTVTATTTNSASGSTHTHSYSALYADDGSTLPDSLPNNSVTVSRIGSALGTGWPVFGVGLSVNTNASRAGQLVFGGNDTLWFRSGIAAWGPFQQLYHTGNIPNWNQDTTGNAATATRLAGNPTINGVVFNGTSNIITSRWGADRSITIGNTTKTVNGSGNVSWSLGEIGAANITNTFGRSLSGPTSSSVHDGSDLNDWEGAFFAYANSSILNRPPGGNGNVLGFGLSSYQVQIWAMRDRIAFRGEDSGTWPTPWREIWHDGNLNPTTFARTDQGNRLVNKQRIAASTNTERTIQFENAGGEVGGTVIGVGVGTGAGAALAGNAGFASLRPNGPVSLTNELRVEITGPATIGGRTMWDSGNFTPPTDSGWVAISPASGWSNSTGEAPLSYRKVGSLVHLRGTVTGGSGLYGTLIGTLPVEARPPFRAYIAAVASGVVDSSAVQIQTNGEIQVYNGGGDMSLDGVSFYVD